MGNDNNILFKMLLLINCSTVNNYFFLYIFTRTPTINTNKIRRLHFL